MLNHHTHPTDPIRDKKTDAFDTSMASPSRQHNFTVRVSHRYIITFAECGRSRHRPSLGAPAVEYTRISEFRRSHHRIWALPPSLGALRWWWSVFKCICVLSCQYYQTLWVLWSASGSDTRAWFSRNGSRHSWGRVLRHISTSLAITEWGLGIYSWFMTSCALVRLFGAGRSLGWGAGTLNWWVVSSHCRNVTSWMRWCPRKLVTPRAEDTRWESRETTRMDRAKSVVRFVQGIA